MNEFSKNVVILALNSLDEKLSQGAEFCLDVALHRDGRIDEVWVLSLGKSNAVIDSAKFSRWGDTLKVQIFHIDSKTWPMDVGNNIYLRTPLCAYAALRNQPALNTIYTPLHGASAFFALQARKGGLISQTTKFVTTCYLPRRLEVSGGLILPQKIENVVDAELEEYCAQFSDEFWISHDALTDDVSKIFKLPNKDKIFVLPLPASGEPIKSIERHIIYAGPTLPLYGFDAFCDLAEQLAGELNEVTVIVQNTSHKQALKWSKTAKKRLSKLKVTLNWIHHDSPGELLSDINSGVLVALLRAPFLSTEIRDAMAAGLTTVWGTGFDLNVPNLQSENLYAVVSDARKATQVLQNLWGEPPLDRPKPRRFKDSHKSAVKPLAPKKFAPIKLLSVVVTHHNRPDFLAQCLNSLAAQTYSDFEVIIADDGSLPDIVNQVEDLVARSPLKSIQLTKIENSYPAAARNHGAELARGDALFFVDDDNILDPGCVAALRKAITQHDLALSFFQTFTGQPPRFEGGDANQGLADLKGPAYGFAGLLPGCGLFHNLTGNASVMIRRRAFEDLGGFSSKFGIGLEDYALMLKGAFRDNLTWVVLPEPYLNFRLHDDKIRNSHVDWVSPVRLQAGHWRVIETLSQENSGLPAAALAYARQLHELTQYSYIAAERPKYFRLRSIALHQYFRPFLSGHAQLRRRVVKFTSGESRIAKLLERWLF